MTSCHPSEGAEWTGKRAPAGLPGLDVFSEAVAQLPVGAAPDANASFSMGADEPRWWGAVRRMPLAVGRATSSRHGVRRAG